MIHNKPIVRIDTRMICVDILEVVCAIKLYQIGGHAKKQLIKLHETCLFVGAEATTSKSLGLAAAKRVPWAQRRDFDCKRFACLTRPIENVDWFLLICTVSFVGIKWCFTFYYSKSPLNHDLGNMFRFLKPPSANLSNCIKHCYFSSHCPGSTQNAQIAHLISRCY